MTDLTIKQVLGYVVKTLQIDESGDASLNDYVREVYSDMDDYAPATTDRDFMVGFLIWANGPNWKEFLDAAKVGDYPSQFSSDVAHAHIIRDLDDYWEVTFANPVAKSQTRAAEDYICGQVCERHDALSFDWQDDQTVEVIPRP